MNGMSKLYVARRPQRQGLLLPMEGTKEKPRLVFFLPKTDRSHLDELIRKQLESQGVTRESDIQAIIDKAEEAYEQRVKTHEAHLEIRRLMQLKANGAKLISAGPKKWREAFFRPIK